MSDNMMKNEVKYLREHLREIYQYKLSMRDISYDMPLELLTRCCVAFDYLQQELQRKDNNWNELKEWLKNDLKEVYRDAEYRHNIILEVLDKMEELEEK